MQGEKFKDHWVFLYASMLHTASPLLKEIYCESHRREPWAVHGSERRIGRYLFPGVLSIEEKERDALLHAIPRLPADAPDWVGGLVRRFGEASRTHQRALGSASRGCRRAALLEGLVDATCRVLSCGIFKEVFEYADALTFLARYMPVGGLRDKVLALYQPLCIPHFLKFEMKLAFFSGLYGRERDERRVRQCIGQCAHHSRFFIEDTPFDDPAVMREEMERALALHGDMAAHRRELLRRHREAVREALLAERDILQILKESGVYSLRTTGIVKDCLRFIQFIATYEELKHIFTVQTARIIGTIMKERRLPTAETDLEGLLAALR